MKKLMVLAAFVGLIAGCGSSGNDIFTENVVVTNRGSASLTVIDAATDVVKQTVSIPDSEPMYVVYVPQTNLLYVGDRAQSKVHVLDPKTFAVQTSIAVGNGVFHMWADGQGQSLWVANDIDNTISVIKLSDNTVRTIALANKPHDVFLTADGQTAFVSMIITDAADQVVRFNAQTLAQEAQVAVGEDPHLFFVEQNQRLYVPNQTGGLFVFDRNLQPDYTLALAGAHGIYPSRNGQYVFMTNLPGSQLYSLSTATKNLAVPALPVTPSTPHNLVVNGTSQKLFVTHSGATANQVTIYSVDLATGGLTSSNSVTAGTNPFGITYYAY